MTSRSRIPGKLDSHALARLAADPRDTHRPEDPVLLAREARHLIALGLSVSDAAQALHVTPRALSDLLATAPTTEHER